MLRVAKLLRRCRTVHPRTLREANPLTFREVLREKGEKRSEGRPIVLQSLDEAAQLTPSLSVSGRQLWNSTKLIRGNRHIRHSHGACVIGGAGAIRRVWRDYKIQPNVVYVPDTEPTIPDWCVEDELPTCIVRCPPVDINRQLLSAEMGDGYAAEFPTPPSPTLEAFLGEKKPVRLASMLALVGLRIPSNVGVLLRAAVDMGFDSVLLCDCVDLFNEKVLRASGGAVFSPKIKLFETQGNASISVLSSIALEHRLLPLLAVPSQEAEPAFAVARRLHESNAARRGQEEGGDGAETRPCYGPLLVLGSESQGLRSLSGDWPVPHKVVSIPLPNPAIDSINVSVAGSVLLHAFRPRAEEHFAEVARLGPNGSPHESPEEATGLALAE
ncbi:hypothetical protein DQ04_03211090 [Trypanosoma grayi]|uniref:hypothetical protein n=1 Tax=Trypanosoma grayi TaxID=71804 RepID=UPI0004F3F8D0|nr:hypothetical protein DQ04_03211090 [Trypanosoma grayi]KEG10865.1 hypothetical protein DQ04_03211090 [Trypanosoma grayi]